MAKSANQKLKLLYLCQTRTQRSDEEQSLIREAKAVLMYRNGMTEEEAHRFLQKQSMDHGAKLTDTARMVLASN